MSNHTPTYTTQKQVRRAFREAYERWPIPGVKWNDYCDDIRKEFCYFINDLARDGAITEALAQRVTL